ncbi:MAG: zinc-ribbon domain-containing protein, partial [Myxococcales bacterium]|nr:zinc-ribbon domain-containing protein [Myxococcales bacterium]
MIVCPRCDKENQDHYKFCLGCGAELPRDAAKAPEGFTAPTPPAGVPIAAPPAAQFGGAAAPAPVAAPPQFGGAAAVPSFGGAPVA